MWCSCRFDGFDEFSGNSEQLHMLLSVKSVLNPFEQIAYNSYKYKVATFGIVSWHLETVQQTNENEPPKWFVTP